MSSPALTVDALPKPGPNVVRFGMLTFLASEAMLFAGLISGYMILRSGAGVGWQLPEGLKGGATLIKTLIATGLLLSSSVTLHFSESRLIRQTRGGKSLLLLTIVLGSLFLANQADEWRHLFSEGFWFNTAGIMGLSFFVLTGVPGWGRFMGGLLLCFTLVGGLWGEGRPARDAFL